MNTHSHYMSLVLRLPGDQQLYSRIHHAQAHQIRLGCANPVYEAVDLCHLVFKDVYRSGVASNS
jgi:hypothetical protein